ncbi:hypothetical protein NM688_g8230 [Phlebia brevispora]|uniref:Uncharacterized protein n=1 Tax=Phlebia brevispora TaxID=194682 RepID=A0ACC1RVM1_9APHY|nr:hypothetical protein NM688_g8230 [Phlebia brevispora]
MPNIAGINGYKPSPPDDLIRPLVEQYVARGFKNRQIVAMLIRDGVYDTSKYSLSVDVLKKKRSRWRLRSTRGENHTLETVAGPIERVRTRFPSIGSHLMKDYLREEEHIQVSRELIMTYMRLNHPDDVERRRANRLIRRQFWCVGVNDIWMMDQHDKWRKWELFLHIGVEPMSSLILWLTIWWTNRNPRVTCSYYLDTVKRHGKILPLLTQSDPGTENNGIANAHTMLRHKMDPSLEQSLQHRFVGGKRNIKPEIHWRLLRQSWTPGFEDVLNEGFNRNIYDPDDALQRLVFHYIFIPWLQRELDTYVARFNDRSPRKDRKKLLPLGRPIEIFEHPESFGTLDFAIQGVDDEYIEEVRTQFANPEDSVFDLVPPRFAMLAAEHYGDAGVPEVNRENAWDIYLDLLSYFHDIEEEEDGVLATEIAQRAAMPPVGEDPEGAEHMELLDMPRCPPRKHRIEGGREETIEGRRVKIGGKLVFITEEEESVPQADFTDESSEGDL